MSELSSRILSSSSSLRMMMSSSSSLFCVLDVFVSLLFASSVSSSLSDFSEFESDSVSDDDVSLESDSELSSLSSDSDSSSSVLYFSSVVLSGF
jgi:hypothetical protein